MRVRRALLSVFDKDGLLELADGLVSHGVGLIATGGTYAALQEAGIEAISVEELTGFGQMLDGRVKTLHPAVHAAILARRSDREAGITPYEPIDLVVVNLYPFEDGVSGRREVEGALEELIDIGGPTMMRAAAKNWDVVGAVCDPADYPVLLEEMRATGGEISAETRRRLAGKVFRRTAAYDHAIASWLAEAEAPGAAAGGAVDLRYGENPHQSAQLVPLDGEVSGVPQAEVLQGKQLSYNNIVDADAALCLMAEIAGGHDCVASVVIKHLSPCGAAMGATPDEALEAALATDPVSAFGGIIGLSAELDEQAARRIGSGFYEIVLAPGFSPAAREILAAKKNLRLMQLPVPDPSSPWRFSRSVRGGTLVQDSDNLDLREEDLQVVTKREPTGEEWEALRFSWKVCKYVRSNAIVFGNANRILGIGGGQPSRVQAARIAIAAAAEHGHDLKGSVVASDAFFPFRDGVDVAAEAGAACVIQPGGSIRDEESIAAADEHGMAMVLTGVRHFRH